METRRYCSGKFVISPPTHASKRHIKSSRRPRTAAPNATLLMSRPAHKESPTSERDWEPLHKTRVQTSRLARQTPSSQCRNAAFRTSDTLSSQKQRVANCLFQNPHYGLIDTCADKLTNNNFKTHRLGLLGALECPDSRFSILEAARQPGTPSALIATPRPGTASTPRPISGEIEWPSAAPVSRGQGGPTRAHTHTEHYVPPKWCEKMAPNHQIHQTHVPLPTKWKQPTLDMQAENEADEPVLPAFEILRRARCFRTSTSPRAGSQYTFRIGDVL